MKLYDDVNGSQIAIYQSYFTGWVSYLAVITSPVGDTLGTVQTPRTRNAQFLQSRTGFFNTPALFSEQVNMEYTPGRGILVTTGKLPVIEWYNLSGTLSGVFRLGLDAVPITVEDRKLAESYFENMWTHPSMAEELKTWRSEAIYPKNRAHWSSVQIDENGYIWLEDSGSLFNPTERLFMVLSSEGQLLGRCVLPQGNGRISHGHYVVIQREADFSEYHMIVFSLDEAIEGWTYPN